MAEKLSFVSDEKIAKNLEDEIVKKSITDSLTEKYGAEVASNFLLILNDDTDTVQELLQQIGKKEDGEILDRIDSIEFPSRDLDDNLWLYEVFVTTKDTDIRATILHKVGVYSDDDRYVPSAQMNIIAGTKSYTHFNSEGKELTNKRGNDCFNEIGDFEEKSVNLDTTSQAFSFHISDGTIDRLSSNEGCLLLTYKVEDQTPVAQEAYFIPAATMEKRFYKKWRKNPCKSNNKSISIKQARKYGVCFYNSETNVAKSLYDIVYHTDFFRLERAAKKVFGSTSLSDEDIVEFASKILDAFNEMKSHTDNLDFTAMSHGDKVLVSDFVDPYYRVACSMQSCNKNYKKATSKLRVINECARMLEKYLRVQCK